jgi:serine/threonine protein kinase
MKLSQEDIDCELRNARKIKSWKHPNIVKVLSITTDDVWDGHLANFIQMEKCQINLSEKVMWLKRDKTTIEVGEYFNILTDVLEGLKFLHGKGIIHRDIKEKNSISESSQLMKYCERPTEHGHWRILESQSTG